jgi:hypothetical protein
MLVGFLDPTVKNVSDRRFRMPPQSLQALLVKHYDFIKGVSYDV